MNLFRLEEHAKNWVGYREEAAGGLFPLDGRVEMFSASLFRERLKGHYVSHHGEYDGAYRNIMQKVTGNHPFWQV